MTSEHTPTPENMQDVSEDIARLLASFSAPYLEITVFIAAEMLAYELAVMPREIADRLFTNGCTDAQWAASRRAEIAELREARDDPQDPEAT